MLNICQFYIITIYTPTLYQKYLAKACVSDIKLGLNEYINCMLYLYHCTQVTLTLGTTAVCDTGIVSLTPTVVSDFFLYPFVMHEACFALLTRNQTSNLFTSLTLLMQGKHPTGYKCLQERGHSHLMRCISPVYRTLDDPDPIRVGHQTEYKS